MSQRVKLDRVSRWRILLVAILALFLGSELVAVGEALANVGAPGAETAQWAGELVLGQSDPVLLARRRVRRKRRRPRRRKPAPAPKPKPDEEQRDEATATAAPPAGGAAPAADALRRGARVEFDGRLVQGQMAKSGAIYLVARKRAELRSMVKERTGYRKEILRTIYTPSK